MGAIVLVQVDLGKYPQIVLVVMQGSCNPMPELLKLLLVLAILNPF